MTDAQRSDLAHLYRRAGFGATPAELDAAVTAGYAATVSALVHPAPTDPGVAATPAPTFDDVAGVGKAADAAARKEHGKAVRGQVKDLELWWLQRMAAATNPFPEKMAFFWHGHFATSVKKVRSAGLMLRQNELFRSQGLGAFDALDLAISRDPAMMRWLDTAQDVKAHPNENFARENMELFTLGYGNYSETDVREAARCFTGWRYNKKTDAFEERAALHDTGSKTVLGQIGAFDGADVVRILTHSQASLRWVPTRVWSRFARTTTFDPVIAKLTAAYGTRLDLQALFTAVLLAPEFVQTKAELVKQPVEYVIGALRSLAVQPNERHLAVLTELGQVPFEPPNVGGWPYDDGWLSTAAAYSRLQFAKTLAGAGDISAVADVTASQRIDAAAHLLSIDGFGTQSRSALTQVADNPEQLVTLALCSPEYVVN